MLQVMYHVVFFGKVVSRAWVNSVCIRDFSSDDDPEDMGQVFHYNKYLLLYLNNIREVSKGVGNCA